jgi:hypothetical protein
MNTKAEKYKILVDVFKGYLDTALTGNIWFYAFTGAVVTYYLSNREGKPYLKYSLFLPFFLGILIIVLFLIGRREANTLEQKMFEENDELRDTPPVKFLGNYLLASVVMIGLVCVCLFCLFVEWPPSLLRP